MRGRRRAALLCLALALSVGCAKKPIETDQELYDQAMRKMEKGDYYKARGILEEIVKRGNEDPELAPLVQLAYADAYFGKKGSLNLADAMTRYRTFLTFYPTHPKADYAQYRLGLCHFQQVASSDRDQRETVTALAEFLKVERLYPDSPYVDLAAEKINECKEVLAEHEFRVGMFYLRRKAYLGAIDRFLDILDRYPRYTRKAKLYYHLGASLVYTNRIEEGDVYLRKLVEAYPKTVHATKASLLMDAYGGGG